MRLKTYDAQCQLPRPPERRPSARCRLHSQVILTTVHSPTPVVQHRPDMLWVPALAQRSSMDSTPLGQAQQIGRHGVVNQCPFALHRQHHRVGRSGLLADPLSHDEAAPIKVSEGLSHRPRDDPEHAHRLRGQDPDLLTTNKAKQRPKIDLAGMTRDAPHGDEPSALLVLRQLPEALLDSNNPIFQRYTHVLLLR